MEARFLYHSFPRRRGDKEKGLKILRSIAKSGLLLTPEKSEWCEYLDDGSRGNPIEIFQKRACFTELSTKELVDHSKTFGSFSIEFRVEELIFLGAIPVFYLPSIKSKDSGLSALSGAFMARLAEIQELLVRLEKLNKLTQTTENKLESIDLTVNGKNTETTRLTIGGAEDLINYLQYESQPISGLVNSFRALSALFYPTENIRFNTLLDYYKQREWRIIGNGVKNGIPVCSPLDECDKKLLIDIDADFFSKQMKFPSGEHKLVDQCQKLTEFEGKGFLDYANRLFVPGDLEEDARKILKENHIDLPIEVFNG